ncbi:hypothetical protein ACQZV8_09345 [Magnetococcales bacterium HHB-1]
MDKEIFYYNAVYDIVFLNKKKVDYSIFQRLFIAYLFGLRRLLMKGSMRNHDSIGLTPEYVGGLGQRICGRSWPRWLATAN